MLNVWLEKPVPGLWRMLFSLLFFPFSLYAQDTLSEGRSKMYTLRSGEEKRFMLRSEPGKVYYVRAEQIGIDIELQLLSEKGEELLHQDAPNGPFGPETMEFNVKKPRTFILRVRPLKAEGNTPRGRFTLAFESAPEQNGTAGVMPVLQPSEMKKDLRIFRQIREKANSGLYRYRTKAETDALYAKAYKAIQQPLPLSAFYKILLELTDFEGSCHNSTALPQHGSTYTGRSKGYFPFSLKYLAGKIYVNSDSVRIPAGSRIHSVNGLADSLLIKSFYKYFPGDGYTLTQKNASAVNRSFGWLFPFEHGVCDSFRISYSLPGSAELLQLDIASVSAAEHAAAYAKRHSKPLDDLLDPRMQPAYGFRMEGDSAAVLSFRRFDMAYNAEDPAYAVFCTFLDSVFSLLNERKVPHLIIDIRNNPGGNDPTYEKVFTYLSPHSFRENTEAYILFPKVPLPRYYAWETGSAKGRRYERQSLNAFFKERYKPGPGGRYFQDPSTNPLWQPDRQRYTGKIYLLINADVASAASHFASLMRGYSHALLIGEETVGGYYGHNGHIPVEYRLPASGIHTRFSVVHVTQDAPSLASQPLGRGVLPDITLYQTPEDFLRNRDTQMEYVLKQIYTTR